MNFCHSSSIFIFIFLAKKKILLTKKAPSRDTNQTKKQKRLKTSLTSGLITSITTQNRKQRGWGLITQSLGAWAHPPKTHISNHISS